MRHLAPYQIGLWLAEYGDMRCQLCRIYRSAPPSQRLQIHSPLNISSLLTADTTPNSPPNLPNKHWFLTKRLNSGLLCSHCHNSIAWLPKPFEVDIAVGTVLSIQAATYYDYPIRQAIRAFKHDEDMTKLPLLLHVLRQLPRPHGCHHDNSVIVAMPTTEQRVVKRGFDPVSILAAQLSKHWHIPLWQGVERIDNTISQQGLTRAERLSNLNNAFAVIENPHVKRLILFDDVATTGASLQALGRVLIGQSNGLSDTKPHNSNQYHLLAYALAHGSQS
ncbi:ComF family protein [Psychrobacter sp. ANT_WB68]|uniref:ComF family protein n=1 Tax=Psychrobacter sp. ANT_WB68 TaxID=2597355 RepID=UPI0021CF9ADD|nr:ComF family protein [Psychrobacter sp. ANT_WB68]